MFTPILYRHPSKVLLPLLLIGSFTSASASAPAQLPCTVWAGHQTPVCMRSQAPLLNTKNTPNYNLAIDQALGSLRNDILIVSKPIVPTPNMQVSLRNNTPAPITSKVKNTSRRAAAAAPTKAVYAPKLSRSDIVKQELQREKAALRAAENQLNQAKKNGKNIHKWERQVVDRRANISAMQAELSRL